MLPSRSAPGKWASKLARSACFPPAHLTKGRAGPKTARRVPVTSRERCSLPANPPPSGRVPRGPTDAAGRGGEHGGLPGPWANGARGGSLLKERVQYVCQACGSSSPRWMGRCPECGSFNTMVEERVRPGGPRKASAHSTRVPVPLESFQQDAALDRRSSGIPEVDRVLGGGVVPGALILLGGDPGIGKSTLMLQVASWM